MIWNETSLCNGLFSGEAATVGCWTLLVLRSWRGWGWSATAHGRRIVEGIEETLGAARAAAAAAVLARARIGDLSAHERAALTVTAQQRIQQRD